MLEIPPRLCCRGGSFFLQSTRHARTRASSGRGCTHARAPHARIVPTRAGMGRTLPLCRHGNPRCRHGRRAGTPRHVIVPARSVARAGTGSPVLWPAWGCAGLAGTPARLERSHPSPSTAAVPVHAWGGRALAGGLCRHKGRCRVPGPQDVLRPAICNIAVRVLMIWIMAIRYTVRP